MERSIEVNLDDGKLLSSIGRALSSEVRIEILKLLKEKELNINEIAEKLSIPASSAAAHVKALEEAGLIHTHLQPAVRGSMKVCSVATEQLVISMQTNMTYEWKTEIISMPIGHFVDYKVEPTCGIVSEKTRIGEEDEPRCFFEPDRVDAQLIWFGKGYLEYRFPNHFLANVKEKELEISMELCSEDHEYNMDYPSDITVWINGIEVATWTCPSDFGGRRGKWNPDWWPDKNTQYGLLKTWKLTEDGSYLDKEKVSNQTIKDYHLFSEPYITVRVGIAEDAVHIGGINLFGECFGDYHQNILMKISYES